MQFLLLSVMTLLPVAASAQGMVTVTGTVTDANGDPLIGCTVQLKGSSVGTITDLDGRFKLQVPEGKTLTFSYIGYKTKEVKAQKTMKVTLEDDTHVLNEVVAVGYGTMKRSDITGSVVSVKAEDMEQTSAATMDQMLQGRAAGLTMTSNSGAAGSSTSIQIRGVNSLNSSNEPVYVIDGSIVRSEAGQDTYSNPLDGLNPNDIESIEILKDASATAIYGAQAANGVIIVNMKKGKEGAPRISFKATAGFSNLPKKLDVMNLRQMAAYITDLGISETSSASARASVSEKSAAPSTAAARGVMSSRLPTGVGTMYSLPWSVIGRNICSGVLQIRARPDCLPSRVRLVRTRAALLPRSGLPPCGQEARSVRRCLRRTVRGRSGKCRSG